MQVDAVMQRMESVAKGVPEPQLKQASHSDTLFPMIYVV